VVLVKMQGSSAHCDSRTQNTMTLKQLPIHSVGTCWLLGAPF